MNLKKGAPEACDPGTRPRYITDITGKINSPNYPQPYDGNDLCEWHIESLDNDVNELLSIYILYKY